MARIFISYRRADSTPESRRIYDALVERFGEENVFRDKDRIPKGKDFRTTIEKYVFASDEMLVLIGQKWLDIREDSDPAKRRLDNPEDFVRIEIDLGLRHVEHVTPVVVQDALMPGEDELPRRLVALAFRNAYFLRPDHFEDDLRELVDDISRRHAVPVPPDPIPTLPPDHGLSVPDKPKRDSTVTAAYIAGGFAVFVAMIAGIFGLWQGVFANSPNTTPAPTTAVAQVAEITSTQDVDATQTADAAGRVPTERNTTVTAVQDAQTEAAALVTLMALSATPTPAPTLSPEQRAQTPVARNADWTPVEREFDGVTMMLVPAGEFMMGSSAAEIEAALALCNDIDRDSNCPRDWFEIEARNGNNRQRFSTPFWIDKFEVSRGQYQACVNAGVCDAAPASDFSTTPQHPIHRVTWFQAQAYCEWRSGRLPTEAEWEYAARGPDGLIYPWGNSFSGTEANHCDKNCADAGLASNPRFIQPENDDGYAATAPIGSYPQGTSWVGALDMAGNVWEWTNSLYRSYPYMVSDGRENGANNTDPRVLRGGLFRSMIVNLRSTDRVSSHPANGRNDNGMRCVRFP